MQATKALQRKAHYTSVKYAWVKTQTDIWPIAAMCHFLNVSESGYYHHNTNICAQRCINDQALITHIRIVHAEVKGEYDWPRIWRALAAKGFVASKERVRNLMQHYGIKARGKRKFVVTTDIADCAELTATQLQPYCPQSSLGR